MGKNSNRSSKTSRSKSTRNSRNNSGSLSPAMRDRILKALDKNSDIASSSLATRLHLTTMQVAAVKAHRTMGRY